MDAEVLFVLLPPAESQHVETNWSCLVLIFGLKSSCCHLNQAISTPDNKKGIFIEMMDYEKSVIG